MSKKNAKSSPLKTAKPKALPAVAVVPVVVAPPVLNKVKKQNGGKRPGAGMPKGHKTLKTRVKRAAQAKKLKQLGLTAQRVLDEIALHGFSNVQDLFDGDGNLRPIQTLTREQAASIASLEVIKKNAEAGDGHIDTVHKLKVWDKIKSLEMLAKHFALLTERLEHSGGMTIRHELAD